MPAIYQNLRTKCIEIKHFAFLCTICTRVQIFKTPFTWPKIQPGCKYALVLQVVHMNLALDYIAGSGKIDLSN